MTALRPLLRSSILTSFVPFDVFMASLPGSLFLCIRLVLFAYHIYYLIYYAYLLSVLRQLGG